MLSMSLNHGFMMATNVMNCLKNLNKFAIYQFFQKLDWNFYLFQVCQFESHSAMGCKT